MHIRAVDATIIVCVDSGFNQASFSFRHETSHIFLTARRNYTSIRTNIRVEAPDVGIRYRIAMYHPYEYTYKRKKKKKTSKLIGRTRSFFQFQYDGASPLLEKRSGDPDPTPLEPPRPRPRLDHPLSEDRRKSSFPLPRPPRARARGPRGPRSLWPPRPYGAPGGGSPYCSCRG